MRGFPSHCVGRLCRLEARGAALSDVAFSTNIGKNRETQMAGMDAKITGVDTKWLVEDIAQNGLTFSDGSHSPPEPVAW
ncbi:MAG: hypothetical protein HC773_27185 [Scytonema sp. CRU_2_7]|nr:hypothetical protein [Scytonema sp. CRU_2_7]